MATTVDTTVFDGVITGTTWTYVNLLMGGAVTMTVNDTLVPRVVRLPAAAWLFGSALLGLAGIGGKRLEKLKRTIL